MDEFDEQKTFRTLKGFISGDEREEESYFCYSATLRIWGDSVPFEEISNRSVHNHCLICFVFWGWEEPPCF
jgi:hypothetical protein